MFPYPIFIAVGSQLTRQLRLLFVNGYNQIRENGRPTALAGEKKKELITWLRKPVRKAFKTL